MYFKSNAEYVNEACTNIEDHFKMYGTSEGVVGVFVSIDLDMECITTLPIVGEENAKIDFENISFGDEYYQEQYMDLGGFMKSDFKDGTPSQEEMGEIRRKLEKKVADLEKKYHFEKHSFEECGKEYETVMQNLTDTEKGRLCMAQSSIMVEGRNDWAISQYDAIWDKLPMVGSQILLWRAGEMQPEDRPYISATYSRDVALKFAAGDEEKTHGILVKPTARMLPMFLLESGDPEKEVIIKTECLQVENGYFVYK